jgi:hypothetical protein
MLERITIRNILIKTVRTTSMPAQAPWFATVCLDGKPIVYVEKDIIPSLGNFSVYIYTAREGGHSEMASFLTEATKAVQTVPGGIMPARLGDLLSCMNENMTALEAVPVWRKTKEHHA